MAREKLTVRSSTIIEVLISMIIIMVVFSISMMIYANVMRSSLSLKKIKAQVILEGILQLAKKNNDNENQSFNVDDFRIEQTVNHYNNNTSLVQIDLIAYDLTEKEILDVHEIFYQPK